MMSTLTPTPGQTIGPFFGYALPFERDSELVATGHPRCHPAARHRHRRRGRTRARRAVGDLAGGRRRRRPVGHRLAAARRLHLHRLGPGSTDHRRATTASRRSNPAATEPGAAPFFAVAVFARGLLNRLFTRVYLPDEPTGRRPAAGSLPAERRHTLVAVRDENGLRFDIRLQGADGVPRRCSCAYPGHRA